MLPCPPTNVVVIRTVTMSAFTCMLEIQDSQTFQPVLLIIETSPQPTCPIYLDVDDNNKALLKSFI